MKRLIEVILVAFVAMLALGPFVIPMLHKLKFGQPIRNDGPQSHAVKQGTPTMGGLMMCLVIGVVAMIFAYPEGRVSFMLPAVLFSLGFALIGFVDDYLKVVRKNPKGLRGWYKIFAQMAISIALALFCYQNPAIGSTVYIPFTQLQWDMGIWYIPFAVFVIVAMVNSANLTDGLDGLLAGTSMIMVATFAVIALFAINLLENDLVRNIVVLSGTTVGACLGFLRFNTHPAKIFMGDTGSFLLGGVITFIALALRLPLLLPIVCLPFVASSVSDIIQIGYYKISHGKRIFRMAPLHHHFELGGMPETQIVAMYMMVTFLCALVSLWAVSA